MMSLPRARPFDWTNLGIRAASALVLAPAVVAAVWFGGWAFLLLIAVGVALMSIEWGIMTAPRSPGRLAAAVTAAVLVAVFTAYRGDYVLAWAVMALGAVAAALIARGIAERPADTAFGVIYLAAPCLAFVSLRRADAGREWAILLLSITWAADIAAFLVGSLVKGPKLWPRISPNKTWSGFAGGLAGATVVGVLVAEGLSIALSPVAAGAVGLFGGLTTMAGDLWESLIKRRFGVKDSGDLIPGHGGLLDRVDGLMFAVLALACAKLASELGWMQ